MKNIVRKIFSRENPGSIAFFSTLLATLGSWSLGAWMTLGGVLIDFSGDRKISICFLLIAGGLALTALVCNLGFFYTKVPEKFRQWFPICCILLFFAVAGSGYFFGVETLFYTFIGVFFWLLPLAVFHKEWHWVVPGCVCWTLFLLGSCCFFEMVQSFYKWINLEFTDISPVTAYGAFAGFCAIWAALFFLANLYAGEDSWKKILSPLNVTILIVFLISLTVMSGMDLYEETTFKRNIVHSGHFFGFPPDAAGLGQIYYKNGPCDPDFWEKFQKHLLEFKKETALRKQEVFMKTSPGDIGKKDLESWKRSLENSSPLRKLEENFPATLPPPPREYQKYYLRAISLDEIFLLHDFCRIQVWRIKFAIQNNHIQRAFEALQRINKSIDLLEKDHVSITHAHIHKLLIEKKNALELLLESGKMPQHELEHQLNILSGKIKNLASVERFALAGETVDEIEFREGFWQGGIQITAAPLPAIKNFRWFVPQLWYIFRHSSNIFIREWQKNSFSEINNQIPSAQYLFAERCAYWKKIPRRYTELKKQYLQLEALLQSEKHKRNNGTYPAAPLSQR